MAKKKHPKTDPYVKADRLKKAAEDFTPPAGWHRIGLVLNDDGELCVWIGRGKGSKRRHKEIPIEA